MRHAQGTHNVAMEKDRSLLQSYDYFDAQLSPLGWQQVCTYKLNYTILSEICHVIHIFPTYERLHTEIKHLEREKRSSIRCTKNIRMASLIIHPLHKTRTDTLF